jgi:hypothetical protein
MFDVLLLSRSFRPSIFLAMLRSNCRIALATSLALASDVLLLSCMVSRTADAVPAENPQSADQRFKSARQLPEGVLALDSFLFAEAEDYTGAETEIVLPVV